MRISSTKSKWLIVNPCTGSTDCEMWLLNREISVVNHYLLIQNDEKEIIDTKTVSNNQNETAYDKVYNKMRACMFIENMINERHYELKCIPSNYFDIRNIKVYPKKLVNSLLFEVKLLHNHITHQVFGFSDVTTFSLIIICGEYGICGRGWVPSYNNEKLAYIFCFICW